MKTTQKIGIALLLIGVAYVLYQAIDYYTIDEYEETETIKRVRIEQDSMQQYYIDRK